MTGGADAIDLGPFVTARLDEDEAAATAARREGYPAGRTYRAGVPALNGWWTDEGVTRPISLREGEHAARHDPARALREVEAGRRLIAGYIAATETYRAALDAHARDVSLDRARTKARLDVTAAVMITWQRAVEAKAAVWSDHPDYRKEWAPGV